MADLDARIAAALSATSATLNKTKSAVDALASSVAEVREDGPPLNSVAVECVGG